MKTNLKYRRSLIRAFSIVVSLMAGSVSQVYAQHSDPRIIPPSDPPSDEMHGMTYGEWSARWWQWNLSLPVDQNPSFDGSVSKPPSSLDKPGECSNGANGQLGPVWFLTGVINTSGVAVRNCTVPAGKALFFPIINVECSTLEAYPYYGVDKDELRACVGYFHYKKVYAEIDGVKVRNLHRYVVESPLFNFTVPDYPSNVLGVATPPNTGQSVSKGYHLMLAPLSAGDHVIHFGGTSTHTDPRISDFTLDITYKITVVPEKKP